MGGPLCYPGLQLLGANALDHVAEPDLPGRVAGGEFLELEAVVGHGARVE